MSGPLFLIWLGLRENILRITVNNDARRNGRTLLVLATFCEKVLQEKDGVLSIIRMIDRIVVTVSGPQFPNRCLRAR